MNMRGKKRKKLKQKERGDGGWGGSNVVVYEITEWYEKNEVKR